MNEYDSGLGGGNSTNAENPYILSFSRSKVICWCENGKHWDNNALFHRIAAEYARKMESEWEKS